VTFDSLIGGPHNAALRDAIQEGALRYSWKGHPMWKDPFDLAIYQLLLWREKPRTIIEIGTAAGGSALWLFDMAKVMGLATRVISIDLQGPVSTIPGLNLIRGDAHDLAQTLPEEWLAEQPRPLLVIEDSSHEPETTLAVLTFFDRFLAPGEMVVVEDGNADELYPGRHKRGGPLAGVADFMSLHPGRYTRAGEYCDAFGKNVTWNPDGYWRRV
jgi:cephalosporin hydroxylase